MTTAAGALSWMLLLPRCSGKLACTTCMRSWLAGDGGCICFVCGQRHFACAIVLLACDSALPCCRPYPHANLHPYPCACCSFYGASSQLRDNIIGLGPATEEAHGTWLGVEPVSQAVDAVLLIYCHWRFAHVAALRHCPRSCGVSDARE